jgi:NAD(P)H-hydrate epimerase
LQILKPAYSCQQIKKFEELIYSQGKDPYKLMQLAGTAAFQLLKKHWPDAKSILVLCGTGNNGGDGFVVARLAAEAGLEVRVVYVQEPQIMPAQQAWLDCQNLEIQKHLGSDSMDFNVDVIVDALLGIGFRGQLKTHYVDLIHRANFSAKPILALDVPSGLNADTGLASGPVIQAQKTLTFLALKKGLFTGNAANYCGDILLDELDIPPVLLQQLAPAAVISNMETAGDYLVKRPKDVNKGNFGHVLIVGGNKGMGGAARMSGEAAARCGAGLVSLAVHPENAAVITAQRPELMCRAIHSVAQVELLINKASVIVIGPGLGLDEWAQSLFAVCVKSSKPKVVDADALNLLAKNFKQSESWILTPHPGEAGRLLGLETIQIQQDRFEACLALQNRYKGVALLKGAGSLIQCPNKATIICPYGNPGMATAGMGDVLSGVIGGLLAQGLSLEQAAELGVLVHAKAGDNVAARNGERGLLAMDLVAEIRVLLNF